ncbi:hypothetical protein F9U64_07185 [Gracilibacillus oryzae]|uniref:Uncharacterized protein n=1 Tax=Gracilibacillus oryzae TaxID=1672701 RepID=A0A7C8KWA4_9BACI|nr:permease prefix domain 1-containing protein [Gracilibacillus oryzae]KAB8137992.1 hypothetical protein F9U64_07185 [Gracilibacillus oryzae]
MDTIISYLDNMFASLPNTRQMRELKDELFNNMEDKYYELKQAGKSENEAIGIVISEFGNIDEIIEEFGLSEIKDEEAKQVLTESEVDNYLHSTRTASKWIGVGAVLCILGSAVLVLIIGLMESGLLKISEEIGVLAGISILLVFVATAVGLFIYGGLKLDKFKHIGSKGNFDLSYQVRERIEDEKRAFQPTFMLTLIIGVVLIILSPVVLFTLLTFGENFAIFSVVIMLILVSIAVYLFVYFGSVYDAYNRLLKTKKANGWTNQDHNEERMNDAVASIIWPLAVIIFLISGFIYHLWHINWIIFPIAALISAMFSGAYAILGRKDK